MSHEFQIPNRFESILGNPKLQPAPLLLPVQSDLELFAQLCRQARMQNGGVLTFLQAPSGTGKTTAVHSAAAFDREHFEPIISVPENLDFRQLTRWLQAEIPSPTTKMRLILFDGREISDDSVGVSQFLSGLNQFLRRRSDLVACWPTNDTNWLQSLLGLSRSIGGENFVPANGIVRINGPSREQWIPALERLLTQLDHSLDDLCLDLPLIESARDDSDTLGTFLGRIGALIAARVTDVQRARRLPQVVFVISSGSDCPGEANRIRRAQSLVLKAPELLAYSPQSEPGKWWKARRGDPSHNLGYVISLFQAQLTTLSASAVVYACLHFGTEALRQAASNAGVKEHIGNAQTTLKSTDFFRFLTKTTLDELTSGKKGKTSGPTETAYSSIQALSAKRHKEINQAICALTSNCLRSFVVPIERFEVDAGDQNLFTDAVATNDSNQLHLEFHHVSFDNCNASRMSSYIMDKLRAYAIHYNLIPRLALAAKTNQLTSMR